MTYGGGSAGAPGSHLPAMRTLLRDACGLERVITTEALPPHGHTRSRSDGADVRERTPSASRGRGRARRTRSVRSCVRPTDVTLSCAAGLACRSRSGAAVAANDVRRTESRSATGVTPSRLGQSRQLGCRAEARPHQLQREVGRRFALYGQSNDRAFALRQQDQAKESECTVGLAAMPGAANRHLPTRRLIEY